MPRNSLRDNSLMGESVGKLTWCSHENRQKSRLASEKRCIPVQQKVANPENHHQFAQPAWLLLASEWHAGRRTRSLPQKLQTTPCRLPMDFPAASLGPLGRSHELRNQLPCMRMKDREPCLGFQQNEESLEMTIFSDVFFGEKNGKFQQIAKVAPFFFEILRPHWVGKKLSGVAAGTRSAASW